MKVILAGMNIDKFQLDEIIEILQGLSKHLIEDPGNADKATHFSESITELLDQNNLTPETLSAAYARISRDPRPVDLLREDARLQVGKARRSNRKIIFGLGHASVAEHAVFNLDILGISRYLSEILQSHRLCSFTEKSQRYIRLDQDYYVPEIIKSSSVEKHFNTFVKKRFEDYTELTEMLEKDLNHDPSLSAEDARYVLPLCTNTQMGMTVNARNLEKILQQAASSDFDEFILFGQKLFSVIDGVAPSIIKYTEPSPKEKHTVKSLRKILALKDSDIIQCSDNAVQLLYSTPNGDQLIANAIQTRLTGSKFVHDKFAKLDHQDQANHMFKEIFRYMDPWDAVPREFEFADFIFEICISAAAYAQLKRHRMMTLTAGPYNHSLDVTVPPIMSGNHCESVLRRAAEESFKMSKLLSDFSPGNNAYAMLGCHRRRVVLKINARELIHMSRLREDEHAQWDIRKIVSQMIELARIKMPGCMQLACGKDVFEAHKKSLGF